MTQNSWNATLYEDRHGFVWQYGAISDKLSNCVGCQVDGFKSSNPFPFLSSSDFTRVRRGFGGGVSSPNGGFGGRPPNSGFSVDSGKVDKPIEPLTCHQWYGADLVDLLAPQPGERILDLGCGTGQLTAQIARSQAEVWGIDSSKTMISQAKANYPHLQFAVADARNFHFDRPFNAIFSNAVLHWVREADRAIGSIRRSLQVGGRFVAEFGGKGNVKSIGRSLVEVLEEMGYADAAAFDPWYFPSIGEYAKKLEKQGLEVVYAALFDRPTPLEGGDLGLHNWLEMFASGFLSHLSETDRSRVVRSVEDRLRPTLYRHQTWFADYRRIRIAAVAI